MVKGPIQSLDMVTCCIFQIYFYNDFFNPDVDSKIQNNKKLTEKTIETLLNVLFVLDQDKNKKTKEQYAQKQNITIT